MKKYANEVVFLIDQYMKAGYKVCCIIGIDGSPTCGVNLTILGGGKWVNDRGIFMKILEEKLKSKGYYIPMVGGKIKDFMSLNKLLKDVEKYVK